MAPASWRVGMLAAEFGLNPKTLRYYEDIGLLRPAARTASGYRQYSRAERDRLRFILKARAIGLTLGEIREIAAVRERGEAPCRHVVAMLDRKLEEIDRQMRSLAAFGRELAALRAGAAAGADDAADAEEACICGIIERHQS